MCDTCGCGQPETTATIHKPGDHPGDHHHHDHPHPHPHEHDHASAAGRKIALEQDILAKNNLLAERNRGYFDAKQVFTLNLVSSPGSGKTTLLERTIAELQRDLSIAVIEGDQQSLRDTDRIHATGVPVVQVNTGTGCHLDADMIHRAVRELELPDRALLFIENVGNLVCPALFDLGEAHKVVIISVTEGDDKPQKYPTMFSVSDVCIINKIDLLPYVDFDVGACREAARAVNPHLTFFEVSAKTGEGLATWFDWLRQQVRPS
jgi:hydrogenase nickel incorporation protein HypB